MARTNNINFPYKSFFVVTLLATGFVLGMYALGQNTNFQQKASEATDLNTGQEVVQTINPDGTMGPATAQGNFSNTLQSKVLGKLAVKVNNSTDSAMKNESNAEKSKSGAAKIGKITSLEVKISKAEVHLAKLNSTCTNTNTGGQDDVSLEEAPVIEPSGPVAKIKGNEKWETLVLDDGISTIDLLELPQTGPQLLGLTSLAAGKYTQIRLYVEKATATLEDGQEINLSVPGRNKIIKIVRPFNINCGGLTNLTIEFDSSKSIVKAGNLYLLKPVVARFSITK